MYAATVEMVSGLLGGCMDIQSVLTQCDGDGDHAECRVQLEREDEDIDPCQLGDSDGIYKRQWSV